MTYVSIELTDRQVEVLDLLVESGLYGSLSRDEVLDRIVSQALVAVCGPALVGRAPPRRADRCRLCNWSTPLGLDALARHVEEVHATRAPLFCPYCDVPQGPLEAWRSHILTVHAAPVREPPTPSNDDDIPF
jgi:hypothetical protein